MNQTRRLAAILAADVAGYVISTYECSQFRTEFAADSPLEGEGFEPSVPRKRHNALRDCPFRFLGTLLDRPTFRLETCATLGTARRLVVGTIIAYYARHSFLWRSGMLVDKEGRRSMLRCSRSASWGTLGSNRTGGHAG